MDVEHTYRAGRASRALAAVRDALHAAEAGLPTPRSALECTLVRPVASTTSSFKYSLAVDDDSSSVSHAEAKRLDDRGPTDQSPSSCLRHRLLASPVALTDETDAIEAIRSEYHLMASEQALRDAQQRSATKWALRSGRVADHELPPSDAVLGRTKGLRDAIESDVKLYEARCAERRRDVALEHARQNHQDVLLKQRIECICEAARKQLEADSQKEAAVVAQEKASRIHALLGLVEGAETTTRAQLMADEAKARAAVGGFRPRVAS